MGAALAFSLSEMAEARGWDEGMRECLSRAFGAKFEKAEELVASSAVKKYTFEPSGRVVWIVVGKEQDYTVLPGIYCQCDDFYINVVVKRKTSACYHLLAQLIAERKGMFEQFSVPDSDFIRLNSEWKKQSV